MGCRDTVTSLCTRRMSCALISSAVRSVARIAPGGLTRTGSPPPRPSGRRLAPTILEAWHRAILQFMQSSASWLGARSLERIVILGTGKPPVATRVLEPRSPETAGSSTRHRRWWMFAAEGRVRRARGTACLAVRLGFVDLPVKPYSAPLALQRLVGRALVARPTCP